jgi:hypothetical protein
VEEASMSGILRVSLVGVAVLVPLSGAAQSRPNLSGNWVLVSATASGTGRGENSSGERPIKSNTASGAAFNCGRECTIVHKGQALTIDKALLASNPNPAPAVTLQLNGRQMSVLDSFNPPREIPVTAKWNGNKLEITSTMGRMTTQLVTVDASELVVVTSSGTDGPRVTLKYKKR